MPFADFVRCTIDGKNTKNKSNFQSHFSSQMMRHYFHFGSWSKTKRNFIIREKISGSKKNGNNQEITFSSVIYARRRWDMDLGRKAEYFLDYDGSFGIKKHIFCHWIIERKKCFLWSSFGNESFFKPRFQGENNEKEATSCPRKIAVIWFWHWIYWLDWEETVGYELLCRFA